jgi:nicotinamidase-related amidase
LVLTGLVTSGCYGATASDAVLNKYNTFIVTDAHSDRGKAAVDAFNDRFADYDYVTMIETESVKFSKK